MPRQQQKTRKDVWPETSDPRLLELFEQDVLPRFPELKRHEFRIIFSATKRGALAQVDTWSLRQKGRTVRWFHLITVNSTQADWSQEELAAIIAHEMGHLVNERARIRPKTWEDGELAATSQAIGRGFFVGFQRLFRRLCETPCWTENNTPDGRRILRVKGRRLAGLYCVARGKLFQRYCPFTETLKPQSSVWVTSMQRFSGVQGVCALCKRAIDRNTLVYRCNSCGMIYHEPCLQSYLNRANICPSCRCTLVDEP